MRRRKKTEEDSHDSLLDTISNSVGVLMIVLVISGMTAGEALSGYDEQRAKYPDLTEELIIATQAEADRLRTLLEELKRRWAGLEQPTVEARIDLDSTRSAVARLESELARMPNRNHDPRALSKKQGKLREDAKRLETTLLARADENRKLRARFDRIEASHNEIVRLPDPRPAPGGATAMHVMCRRGRVVVYDMMEMGKAFAHEFKKAATNAKGSSNTSAKIASMIRHFDKNFVGVEEVRWKLVRTSQSLIARVVLQDGQVGEDRETLIATGSRYREALQRLDPSKRYLRFAVWGDSFADYVAARSVADSMGLSAGWTPYTTGQHVQIDLAELASSKGASDGPDQEAVD